MCHSFPVSGCGQNEGRTVSYATWKGEFSLCKNTFEILSTTLTIMEHIIRFLHRWVPELAALSGGCGSNQKTGFEGEVTWYSYVQGSKGRMVRAFNTSGRSHFRKISLTTDLASETSMSSLDTWGLLAREPNDTANQYTTKGWHLASCGAWHELLSTPFWRKSNLTGVPWSLGFTLCSTPTAEFGPAGEIGF